MKEPITFSKQPNGEVFVTIYSDKGNLIYHNNFRELHRSICSAKDMNYIEVYYEYDRLTNTPSFIDCRNYLIENSKYLLKLLGI